MNQKTKTMSNRLDQERESRLQPLRMVRAVEEIKKLGFEIFNQTDTTFYFIFKGSPVTYYPYSGWATGKTIKDGRGLKNLLNQLQNDK